MKKGTNRIFALLMCVVMFLSLLPMGILAEEPGKTAETAVRMPAQGFCADASNGVHVHAWAEEGVFPEGTTMYLRAIGASQVRDIAETALPEQTVTDAVAVDISFRDDRFLEIEQKDKRGVRVTLSLDNDLDGSAFHVIHREDNGAVSVIAPAEKDGAAFESGAFSIYVVAAEEEADPRLEVRFFMPGSSAVS